MRMMLASGSKRARQVAQEIGLKQLNSDSVKTQARTGLKIKWRMSRTIFTVPLWVPIQKIHSTERKISTKAGRRGVGRFVEAAVCQSTCLLNIYGIMHSSSCVTIYSWPLNGRPVTNTIVQNKQKPWKEDVLDRLQNASPFAVRFTLLDDYLTLLVSPSYSQC